MLWFGLQPTPFLEVCSENGGGASGPVSRVLCPPRGVAAISLGPRSPSASNDLPEERRRGPRLLPLFGLSPGGVYLASPVTRTAVRSYRTLSPLPRRGSPKGVARGGLLSVALSLVSRPVAVSNHPGPAEPGLSSPRRRAARGRRSRGAAAWTTRAARIVDPGAHRCACPAGQVWAAGRGCLAAGVSNGHFA